MGIDGCPRRGAIRLAEQRSQRPHLHAGAPVAIL